MVTSTTGLLCMLSYLTGAWLQARGMLHGEPVARGVILAVTSVAVLAHAAVVWLLMFSDARIDLGFFRAGALVALTMALIILATSFSRPLENLFVVVHPVAAAAVGMALFVPWHYHPPAELGAGFVAHMILAILAYAVLSVAVIQSLLVGWQENQLREHKSLAMLRNLPPLQTMEHLLFELLWIGLALLTLAIASGFAYLDDMFAQRVVHHTVLSVLSWVVFAVLLWGRHRAGWRGPTAIRWTLGGFALLMLAYFGSKLVIEVILAA